MEGITIEQLADLRIAIKKNEATLKEKQEANTTLEAINKHLVENNKQLEQELEVQADRIVTAKAENEALREEKEGILSKFAKDNEKAYKELREKEKGIANDQQQNALRLIEIEKRESKLVAKETSNKAMLDEAKSVQKEAKEEAVRAEEKYIEVTAERKKLKMEEEKVSKKKEALQEIEKEIDAKKLAVQEKEIALLEEIQTNRNLVAELQNKEKNNKLETERLEKLNALYNELKAYVTEKGNITAEEVEVFVNGENADTPVKEEVIEPQPTIEAPVVEEKNKDEESTPEQKEEAKEIEKPVEKDPAVLSEMKFGELQKEVKVRWLDLPQNAKKEDLIDLLSK